MQEDSSDLPEIDLVRIGPAARALGIPVKTLRRLADRGDVPSVRTRGGHRLFSTTEVAAALSSPGGDRTVGRADADWRRSMDLEGLDEARVWSDVATALQLEQGDEGMRVMNYAFTEMLNNAIDHSAGTRVTVEVWSEPRRLSFRISDDGVGVFVRVRDGLGLAATLEAAAELSKGKRTTWPERHTGEGIFFTSKAVTLFRLSANGIRLTVDNERVDHALGISQVAQGTVAEAELELPPPRTLRSLFEEFTDDDLRFSRSRPSVKLFGTGLTFVSRSEARRLLADMTDFEDIDVDFAGVEDVGQGFIDELLRVWPSQHPDIQLHPINMNEAVAFMVRRGRQTRP